MTRLIPPLAGLLMLVELVRPDRPATSPILGAAFLVSLFLAAVLALVRDIRTHG